MAPAPRRGEARDVRTLCLVAALLVLPVAARAEKPPVEAPPTGTAWIVSGSLLAAGGVANLATAPLCEISRVGAGQRPACLGTSIGVGVGLLAAGAPLLVVGVRKRIAWLDWQRTTVAPVRSGAVVQLGGSW
jgi:hypothetical protein